MPEGTNARALRLLLVEDSADDAELIDVELTLAGFEVALTRVESGPEMKDALETRAWDAIISDYSLPAFSAEAALATLQSSKLDLPFIIVSGHVGEETAVALMKAGAHDFVMKGRLARLAPALERELREAAMRRERHEAQERMEANEKLLRAMSSAMGDGILVLDRENRLIFMNPEAERLLGWSEHELANRDLHDTLHSHKKADAPHSRETCPILNMTKLGGLYRCYDDVFVRKGGQPLTVSYVVTPIVEQGEIVAAVTVFQDITARKQMENELRESRRQLRALSEFLQTVREEERRRIARELHDELGQALTALKIDLEWLQLRNTSPDDKVAGKLLSMGQMLGKTVESVRRIAEDLRPGMLDDLGLAAAIEWQVEQFQERTGIRCELSMNRDEFELEDRVATSVFRIIQEALTNVARHAEADAANITVEEADGEIRLEVRDNGKGFQPTPKKRSYGLLGIRERVNMLGGEVEILSKLGDGTRVRATIPRHILEPEQ
ncbi:sensor kinase [Sulfurimicrobium lacus]|uniref:Sensor kinase n=1 Tax=Sulfurimicrobium lacus TaxID=2715678 RepID=A0A6F8VG21_9PROT|nr:PAS domain S-box protein [Sulfurimicrobium lacus]BCB28668.1 sensor kinase [Sulfurimicrobium lacus]